MAFRLVSVGAGPGQTDAKVGDVGQGVEVEAQGVTDPVGEEAVGCDALAGGEANAAAMGLSDPSRSFMWWAGRSAGRRLSTAGD